MKRVGKGMRSWSAGSSLGATMLAFLTISTCTQAADEPYSFLCFAAGQIPSSGLVLSYCSARSSGIPDEVVVLEGDAEIRRMPLGDLPSIDSRPRNEPEAFQVRVLDDRALIYRDFNAGGLLLATDGFSLVKPAGEDLPDAVPFSQSFYNPAQRATLLTDAPAEGTDLCLVDGQQFDVVQPALRSPPSSRSACGLVNGECTIVDYYVTAIEEPFSVSERREHVFQLRSCDSDGSEASLFSLPSDVGRLVSLALLPTSVIVSVASDRVLYEDEGREEAGRRSRLIAIDPTNPDDLAISEIWAARWPIEILSVTDEEVVATIDRGSIATFELASGDDGMRRADCWAGYATKAPPFDVAVYSMFFDYSTDAPACLEQRGEQVPILVRPEQVAH